MPQVGANNEPLLERAMYAWTGSSWVKQAIQWGFGGAVGQLLSNLNLSAGTNNLDSTAVPDGEVWRVELVSMLYIGTTPTLIDASILRGSDSLRIFRQLSPTSIVLYDRQTNLTLIEGDKIRATIVGATAGDDFYLHYAGYKMAVA